MKLEKAIEIKLQWRKDNYPTPLADEMNADLLSIEALRVFSELAPMFRVAPFGLLPGETPPGDSP